MPGHHHRAGGLRQSNKRNKRSKASKRSVARAAGGKVMGKAGAAQAMAQQSKADRKNHLQQKRNTKRQELLRKKRGLDGLPPPPRVVGIISLGENPAIEDRICDLILSGADRVVRPHHDSGSTFTCKFDAHKKDGNLTLLPCRKAFAHHGDSDTAAVLAALDLARVCDLILMVIDGNGPRSDDIVTGMSIGGDEPSVSTNKTTAGQDWDHLISEQGDRILTALKSQGLPTPLTVLAHTQKEILDEDHMTMQSMKSLRRSGVKRQLDLRKYVGRFATTEFGSGNDKVLEVDLADLEDIEDDMADDLMESRKKVSASSALIRAVCSMSASPAKWVGLSPRPYILSDTYKYDADANELHLTGFVRGPVPFDVNSLIHVPEVGTFYCKCVKKEEAPLARTRGEMLTEDEIIYPDSNLRQSNEMFATPHALDGEQNLIGFDETEEDFNTDDDKDEKFARPAGWSDYQSAWLDAVDEDNIDDAKDHGELADALNEKPSRLSADSVAADGMDLDDANEISATERDALLNQRRKEQTEHKEFPDEVQVEEDSKARDRFARYRSLKSFRKSFWDPKENLPDSYSSIYHFSSFKATQRSVMNDMKEVARAAEAANGQFWGSAPKSSSSMTGDNSNDDDMLEGFIPSGSYITLSLEGVAPSSLNGLSASALLTAVALLEHENKVSVLHMGLSKSTKCDGTDDVPLKSKDVLTFRCGWRTWKARPVFSQHNLNCDKHKFERFLPQDGAFFAASVFGPVTYTPCPVLAFRERSEESKSLCRDLLAVGSMIGADADRIVVKRIILTGYPVRVHKRTAVVKYMFYDPEDVKWFKPAGLYTKHGLQGNIMESVGEHGTMKCLFNAPIKQHDTVCLPLYKRIYPKFATDATEESQGKLSLCVL